MESSFPMPSGGHDLSPLAGLTGKKRNEGNCSIGQPRFSKDSLGIINGGEEEEPSFIFPPNSFLRWGDGQDIYIEETHRQGR